MGQKQACIVLLSCKIELQSQDSINRWLPAYYTSLPAMLELGEIKCSRDPTAEHQTVQWCSNTHSDIANTLRR